MITNTGGAFENDFQDDTNRFVEEQCVASQTEKESRRKNIINRFKFMGDPNDRSKLGSVS